MQKRSKPRSKKGVAEIAQFPLTIYFMFLILLLPVLNLVTLLLAGCTAYLATNDLAAKAATQPTFAQALNAMAVEAYNFQSNNLAQFVKMSPQGGYTGCGSHLYVLATSIAGAGVISSSADQTLNSNIDETKNIYEMQVVSKYTVSPLVSLASLPLLGSIPGLGQPVTFSFAASRPVEHPGGVQTANNGGNTGTVTPFNRVAATSPGVPPPPSAVTWRNPNIFTQIQQAGETVVSVNIVIVPMMSPTVTTNGNDWTPSGVTVNAGQKVWMDSQAVGVWNDCGAGSSYDADGYTGREGANNQLLGSYQLVDRSAPQEGALLAYVCGSGSPILPWNGQYFPYPNDDSTLFVVGNTMIDHPITRAGTIYFGPNSTIGFLQNFSPQVLSNLASWTEYCGKQMVRVIVTQ